MATQERIMLFLAIFYLAFFTLIGSIDQTDIVITSGTDNINNTFSVIETYAPQTWFESVITFVERIFSNIEGMPTIIQTLIFTPLIIIAIYWLIVFILKFIPFLGGS